MCIANAWQHGRILPLAGRSGSAPSSAGGGGGGLEWPAQREFAAGGVRDESEVEKSLAAGVRSKPALR